MSNIPFGDIAVFDPEFQRSDSFGRRSAQKAIHNYFFLKGLDAVRDGGIVAFITSQGVLNSTKTSVRNELFSQANLVSAIRLPNNLFTDNAGTEVGSDLIVLQKNLSKKEMSQDERLMTVIQTDTKTDLTDNAYFIHHPERIVHTTAKLDTDPYGKPAMVYLHEGKAAASPGICTVCSTRISITARHASVFGFNPAVGNGRKSYRSKGGGAYCHKDGNNIFDAGGGNSDGETATHRGKAGDRATSEIF